MGCCAPVNTNTQVIRNDLSKYKQSSPSKDNQPNDQALNMMTSANQAAFAQNAISLDARIYQKEELLIEEDDLSYLLELHISCANLPNLQHMSKTDPICVLYEFQKTTKSWLEKGRTEVIYDTLNPQFIKPIVIKYKFEERQNLKVEVYDINNEAEERNLKEQNLIGSSEVFVHRIVRESGKPVTMDLTPSNSGTVSIWGEQLDPQFASQSIILSLNLQTNNSDSPYFYKIYRFKEEQIDTIHQDLVPIYRSEVKKGKEITWNNTKILSYVLCKNNFEREIQFEVFEWRGSGDHKLLDKATITLDSINSERKEIKIGILSIEPYQIYKEYSFMEYLHGGLEISLAIAIDFTGSNGNPKDSSSLHYFNTQSNQYLQAIESVGSVLEPYDFDGQIPVMGFGGYYKGSTSHCYPISEGEGAQGLTGAKECYKEYLNDVRLSGPTYYQQIIKYGNDEAQSLKDTNPNGYVILMILTDGSYDDEQASIDQIIIGNALPLSIIIVGVGDSNFRQLIKLDADEEPLKSSTGKIMTRDIVQFVPFKTFKDNPEQLASETLAEIPTQVVQYFNQIGYKPPKKEIQSI